MGRIEGVNDAKHGLGGLLLSRHALTLSLTGEANVVSGIRAFPPEPQQIR
jgi:hypothetical protein